ncbi:MAG: hypothetical protein AB1644_01040 [Candidatus Zixiibacteriota bacterium]
MKGFLGTVGVILLVAGSALAQVTFDFTGAGARAEGMGKAFYGVSDDVSAASWNPAGLIVHEKPMLGFSYGMFAPRGQFDNVEAQYDRSGSFNRVSLLSFIAPVRVRGHQFVGGVSYSKVVDDYSSFNSAYDFRFSFTLPGTKITNMYPAYTEGSSEYHSAPFVLNFAFGTRMYRSVATGFSINVYTGSAISEVRSVTTIDSFPNLGRDTVQLVRLVSQGSTIDSAKYGGINFTLGFRHTSDNLDAGLVIKTPFSLKYEYDRKSSIVNSFNGLVNTASSSTIYMDNNLWKFEIPLIIGAGVGYRPNDKLLLALDAELRQYSGKQIKSRDTIKILPGGNTEEAYSEFDPNYSNGVAIRGGGEYLWETGNHLFPVVPLRAGIALVPVISLPSISFNTDSLGHLVTPDSLPSPTRATEIVFSMGAGVRWTQIHLDAAYSFGAYTQNYQVGQVYDLRMPDVEEKARNHQFTLTFTGYF